MEYTQTPSATHRQTVSAAHGTKSQAGASADANVHRAAAPPCPVPCSPPNLGYHAIISPQLHSQGAPIQCSDRQQSWTLRRQLQSALTMPMYSQKSSGNVPAMPCGSAVPPLQHGGVQHQLVGRWVGGTPPSAPGSGYGQPMLPSRLSGKLVSPSFSETSQAGHSVPSPRMCTDELGLAMSPRLVETTGDVHANYLSAMGGSTGPPCSYVEAAQVGITPTHPLSCSHGLSPYGQKGRSGMSPPGPRPTTHQLGGSPHHLTGMVSNTIPINPGRVSMRNAPAAFRAGDTGGSAASGSAPSKSYLPLLVRQQQQQQSQQHSQLSNQQSVVKPQDAQPSTVATGQASAALASQRQQQLSAGLNMTAPVRHQRGIPSPQARKAAGSSPALGATAQAPIRSKGPVNPGPEYSQSKSPKHPHTGRNPASGYAGVALTPGQTMLRYGTVNALTPYEQSEVLNYPEVYYIGPMANKHQAHPNKPEMNCGYDDSRGDYRPSAHDHLAYRYEIISIIGKGSFGQVLKCYDYKDQTMRAVKIIRNKQRFHFQAKLEVKILQRLVQRDPHGQMGVIHILEHFKFRGHLCIVFELMSINLYDLMRVHDFRGLNLQLVQRFAGQLLSTLAFLRQEGIIHCDLKPENILLLNNQSSALKVIDFGSSCFRDQSIYTYIQSRFYRSPEIILGLKYGHEIDMWSLGCILCELATGRALFPGENEHHQLLLYMEMLGEPPVHLTEHLSQNVKVSGRLQPDNVRRRASGVQLDANGQIKLLPDSNGRIPRPGYKSLAQTLRPFSPAFVNLVSSMLSWDPAERITPEAALKHPWMTSPHPHNAQMVSPPAGPSACPQDSPARPQMNMQQSSHPQVGIAQHEKQGDGGPQERGSSLQRGARAPLTESGNVQYAASTAEYASGDKSRRTNRVASNVFANREGYYSGE